MESKFDKEKRNAIKKMQENDQSRKGSVDQHIRALVDEINSKEDYYTTSSCAGRIRIIAMKPDAKKNEIDWIFVSHEPVSFDEIKKSMDGLNIDKEKEIWFLQESAILHVAARDLEKSQKLVTRAREIGFKKTGMQSFEKRFIMELVNNDHMEMLIGSKGRILISDEYLEEVISIANRRLERNFNKIDKLVEKIKEI